MIQLIDEEDVKKKQTYIKNRRENTSTAIGTISLISADEVIDESKASKINKKEKIIIKENAEKNKKCHLLRWKIKRLLIQENVIKKCVSWETILDVFDSEIVNKDDLTDAEIKAIFRRHSSELIEHHTKYKEIHGVDESLWMTPSEHRNLHNRLRAEGKCNIPSEELTKISVAAANRTEKNKQQQVEFHRTEEYRQYYSDRAKKLKNNWLVFDDILAPNIKLREQISYYYKTGTVTVSSGFYGNHGIKIPTIQID